MSRVDANNNNSPGASPSPSNAGSEYTTTVRSIWFQGFKPGTNNNGMVPNTGYVYVLVPGNGSGNRTDSGAMVGVIAPGGGSLILPASLGATETRFSPYGYKLDSDVDGEGALVTLIGPEGQ